MDTTFSFQLRILLCTHCGAPLEASMAGGQISCRYCQAVNQLSVRDDRPAFASHQAPISEQERINRLRAQDGKPLEATTKMLMSAGVVHALVPGASVSVRVDPEKLSDVLIEAQ
jgi:uncharacterized Zn finger protein (UPF0148 family)